MTPAQLRIDRRSDIPRAISLLQATGAGGALGRAEILRALYQGQIAHIEFQRNATARLVKRFIAAHRLPALILLGDDDAAPSGPDGWPQAERVLRWSRHVIVHAAAGRSEEYRQACQAAKLFGRVVLAETSTAQAAAWAEAVRRWCPYATTMLIIPAGGVHPVPAESAALH